MTPWAPLLAAGVARQRGGRPRADAKPIAAVVGAGVARQLGGGPEEMTIPSLPFWRTVLLVTVAAAF